MVKEECFRLADRLVMSHLHLADALEEVQLETATIGSVFEHFLSAHAMLSLAKKDITTEEYNEAKSKFIDPFKAQINERKIPPASQISEAQERYLVWILDKFAECECGEPEEIQLKIPIAKSDVVEASLKNAGYDVGTDAYYADPDKYVSVIVRATKELELRRGG